MKVDFYRHALTAADANAVADVIASPFLTTGRVAKRSRHNSADYFAVAACAPGQQLDQWRAGNLLAMDIGPGDEVIVPAMTFIASANVVELAGATPVFADVDPETLLLTPEGVAQRVTPRTRAVIPVHLYGQMCDIAAMREMLDARPQAAARSPHRGLRALLRGRV